MYTYEPDRLKRRQARAAGSEEYASRVLTQLPLRDFAQDNNALTAYQVPDEQPGAATKLSAGLEKIAHLTRAGRLSFEDLPWAYESIADQCLMAADDVSEAVKTLSTEKWFTESSYGDLAARIRLVLVKVRKLMTPIENSYVAHMDRSNGVEPPVVFWQAQFAEAQAELFTDLEYLATANTAAAMARAVSGIESCVQPIPPVVATPVISEPTNRTVGISLAEMGRRLSVPPRKVKTLLKPYDLKRLNEHKALWTVDRTNLDKNLKVKLDAPPKSSK